MCTAVSINDNAHLFGRTLDLECSLGERVVITPRGFNTKFREIAHGAQYAMIGAAHLVDGIPLYYDGMNEAGLCAAALNFPVYAVYTDTGAEKRGIPSYAVIPEVLRNCKSIGEAKELLRGASITREPFREGLPPTPLHWLISDKSAAIVVEPVEDGLKIYDTPIGVLSNSPPYPYQIVRLCDYMALSPVAPSNTLAPSLSLSHYSRGMGAIGLPGDFSSSSRFVRAVYSKMHTRPTSNTAISRFFHIMGTVNVPCGAVVTEKGDAVYTVYTSCMDKDEKIYYFTTYNNSRVRGVRLSNIDLDASQIVSYPMASSEDIQFIN